MKPVGFPPTDGLVTWVVGERGMPLGQEFTRVPNIAGEVVCQRIVKVSALNTSPKPWPLERTLTSSEPGFTFCTKSISIDVGFCALAVPKHSNGMIRPSSRPFQFRGFLFIMLLRLGLSVSEVRAIKLDKILPSKAE